MQNFVQIATIIMLHTNQHITAYVQDPLILSPTSNFSKKGRVRITIHSHKISGKINQPKQLITKGQSTAKLTTYQTFLYEVKQGVI